MLANMYFFGAVFLRNYPQSLLYFLISQYIIEKVSSVKHMAPVILLSTISILWALQIVKYCSMTKSYIYTFLLNVGS